MPAFFKLLPTWISDLTAPLVSTCGEVYLVGGAVRNLLLGLPIDDYDFVVRENAIQGARTAADILEGKFYILDHQRQTARALVRVNQVPIKLDFALFNGTNITADLIARDFSINALALRLPVGNEINDPTGGREDLRDGILRPCSKRSFSDDPVRTIRYIRFQQELNLKVSPEIKELVKESSAALKSISGERRRDALMDVISVADLRQAFNEMLDLGIMEQTIPDIASLNTIILTPPHTHNAWDHTIQVAHYCQQLMASWGFALSPPETQHPRISQALAYLVRYRIPLNEYFTEQLSPDRNKYQLLIISALFHDAAKAMVSHEFSGERKRFPGHARAGAKKVMEWAKAQGFSNKEVDYLFRTVRTHMKVSRPEIIEPTNKNLAIHRFFKQAGDGGILTAILHLADVLTTYEDAITDDRWNDAVHAVDNLFDAYFFHHDEIITPPALLDGNAIMAQLQIPRGEQVGLLISALQEAQVSGEVTTAHQAISYLRPLAAKITYNGEEK